MKKMIALCLLSCLLGNVTPAAAASKGGALLESAAPAPQGSALNAEQMDNLLAPIALYPDPLLAQVFPASTFVDQVEQAARYLRGNNNQVTGVDNQSWDVSVRSVAHYPQVIYMMSDKLDWTTALGQAYVNQSTEVLTSVQRLRARAKSAGYLVSTPQQTVIVEKEVIKVVPAQPTVIYVPTYNPQVVYVQPASSGPSTGTVVAATAIAFGAGLAIGAWLNNDCNWHTHTVYYHGWHGSGWISTSVHHVHVNSVYVNRSYSSINVNRNVVHHNVNYNNINRNNVNRNNVNNKNVNRNINNANVDQYRGRSQQASTANRSAARPTAQSSQSHSAFGGYGNASATRSQSQRGQASRASAAQSSRSSGGGGRRGGGGGGRRH